MSNTSRLILVLGDQLDAASAAFDGFDVQKDVIWMAKVKQEPALRENQRMSMQLKNLSRLSTADREKIQRQAKFFRVSCRS